MQYLRVLIVVLLTPLLVASSAAASGSRPAPARTALGDAARLAADRGDRARRGAWPRAARACPPGTLLGPMVVAGALTLAGVEFVVPPVVRELAFALIGLQVGLRFTLDTVRQLGRLLVPGAGRAGRAASLGCFGLAVAAAR